MKPCCVSTWHGQGSKHWHDFMATAKRHGIEPQNADPDFWPGDSWATKEWFRKTASQAKFVREHKDEYSHFMFVDSHDIVFATGWDEIMSKYERFGSPIVFASECYPWPVQAQKDLYPRTTHRCRFLNAGFWMATTDAAMALLAEMESVAVKRELCDQGIAVNAFLANRHHIMLDTACSLCFCCNLDSLNYLELLPGRPKTKDTHQYPCMFHGNGNSPLASIVEALNLPGPRWVPNAEEQVRMSE